LSFIYRAFLEVRGQLHPYPHIQGESLRCLHFGVSILASPGDFFGLFVLLSFPSRLPCSREAGLRILRTTLFRGERGASSCFARSAAALECGMSGLMFYSCPYWWQYLTLVYFPLVGKKPKKKVSSCRAQILQEGLLFTLLTLACPEDAGSSPSNFVVTFPGVSADGAGLRFSGRWIHRYLRSLKYRIACPDRSLFLFSPFSTFLTPL